MTNRYLYALLVGLCLLVACNRDPEVAKRRYLENGNKYFENGKYKEALILYRNALKRDMKYGEAYYRAALAELRLQRYAEAIRDLQRAVELQPENLDALNRLSTLYLNVYLSDRKRPKQLLDELIALHEKYTKRFPGSYEEARLAGYLDLFANDAPAALVNFEKANRLKPYQQDLILVYMQTLAANNRTNDAIKLAWEMVEKQPASLAVYDALVVHYARQNNTAEVERILKHKVEKNPKAAEARVQLAAHYFSQKQREPMLAQLNHMSSNPAEFPRGNALVGDFFMRAREYDEAVKYYRQGLAGEEKDKALYNKRLIEVLVRQNKKDEAFALVNQVLKDDPNDNEAIAIRASLSMLTGTKDQLQAAINDLQTVVSRSPENFVVRYNLGRALLASQKPEAAKVQFEEAIKLRHDYVPPRLALAQIHLQSRDFGKALQSVQDVLSFDPNNVGARMLRTRALLGMGDLKQARNELAQATRQYPELPEARLQMAVLDLQERNFKNAEDGFRKLYTQFNDPRAFMGLIDSFVGQGQNAAAVKLLNEELSKNPDRMEYRLALANIAQNSGDYDGAISEYKAVIAKSPQNVPAWLQLSETHRRAGDIGAAIASVQKAQEIDKNNLAANLQLALLYDTTGKKTDARPVYEQILRIQPENPIALNNLAYLMAEEGSDLDQALTLAQRARQKMPNDVDVADTLGWIYIKKNLPDSAIQIFQDLVQRQPQRATFHYHLAMAQFQKGDRISAKRSCEQALTAKPSKDEENRIRELMSRIG